jgi:carbon-monoxide dehydrogenase small subunit
MLLSAKALLDWNPQPTERQIRTAISGNLCRCTGYQQIVQAITKAGK